MGKFSTIEAPKFSTPLKKGRKQMKQQSEEIREIIAQSATEASEQVDSAHAGDPLAKVRKLLKECSALQKQELLSLLEDRHAFVGCHLRKAQGREKSGRTSANHGEVEWWIRRHAEQ